MGFGSGVISGSGITSGSVFLLHISSPSGLVWFRFGFACLGMVLPLRTVLLRLSLHRVVWNSFA